MDWEGIGQAVVAVLTPLAALLGVGSRRRRLRSEVKENIALLESIKKDEVLSAHTPAVGWLSGRIVLDVARLSGQTLGNPKKPIPWGSVVLAWVLALGFGAWTYWINRSGFIWYSVFPGTVAFLFATSGVGMFMNRQLPANESLPEGATTVRTGTVEERIATAVQFASSDSDAGMFADGGQVGVALRFVGLLRDGRFEDALELADSNWLLCRIQSRLFNMHLEGILDEDKLEGLAKSLHERRQPAELWAELVREEGLQFSEAWANLDPAHLGAASRRRRIARDYDVVVLVGLPTGDGYFVTSATMVPNSFTFLMHRCEGDWLVANHVGIAPPAPGWPPSWWTIGDPAIESLPADDLT
ncbi:MAG: hypothetical protein EOL89_02610 [Actinobacteria bacterium]|nr:hypothetical protein [Actinomycetota bacterium]